MLRALHVNLEAPGEMCMGGSPAACMDPMQHMTASDTCGMGLARTRLSKLALIRLAASEVGERYPGPMLVVVWPAGVNWIAFGVENLVTPGVA